VLVFFFVLGPCRSSPCPCGSSPCPCPCRSSQVLVLVLVSLILVLVLVLVSPILVNITGIMCTCCFHTVILMRKCSWYTKFYGNNQVKPPVKCHLNTYHVYKQKSTHVTANVATSSVIKLFCIKYEYSSRSSRVW